MEKFLVGIKERNKMLSFKGKTFVKPSGIVETAKYVLVGEQPYKNEVRYGRPFAGPSGQVLDECFRAVGIVRNECYITNVIKDMDEPLAKYIYINNQGIVSKVSDKAKEYIASLGSEIRKAKSSTIVAIGNVAVYALCGLTKPAVTKRRGSVLESTLVPNKNIIPIIHPSTVVRPKNQYLNKLLIQFDLKRVREITEEGYKPEEYTLILNPSFNDTLLYLNKVKKGGLNGDTVDFDIEIFNQNVSCISFSHVSKEAISIPFLSPKGDHFTVEQEKYVWALIAGILEDIRIKKRGQNVSFDSHFLLRRYGIKARPLDDTMVAQRIIMQDYPIGLDFITSIWTKHPYYKDEGKAWKTGIFNWNIEWGYNAKDSLMCQESAPKQMVELVKQDNVETYERQVKMIEPLVYMQERGVKVDVEGMKKAYIRLEKEVDELREELNEMAGRDLNPNSNKQLVEYFYGRSGYGHKAYKSRKTGHSTVDNNAMKRLIRKGFGEAKLIQIIRKKRKQASTYLNPEKIDNDGRIRCSYNPVGTKFSRISSSKNIFGTGMNMQNIPDELLKYFIVDDGYIYYSPDLSQAENRIVAYVGDVIPMIEAFEGGKDVHRLTAGLIFNKKPDEISSEPNSSTLGDGTHSERFWGKKSNHGLNYDLGYKSFAFENEIPERDGRLLVDRYHHIYPGVRNTFHAYIRRCLRENRTITNLMGRHTRFLGEWGDKLFKEGYSCIPQGTVGDVINERGVEYIYYDQENFKPVELLTQIHDSIGFQIRIDTPWIEHARILLQIKKSLETPLSFRGREFVIPVDLMVGFSMSKQEGKELKGSDFSTDKYVLATKLEMIHKELSVKKNTK